MLPLHLEFKRASTTILRRDHRSNTILLLQLPSRYIYLQHENHHNAIVNLQHRCNEVCFSRVKDLSIYHQVLTLAYRIPDARISYAAVAVRQHSKSLKAPIARKKLVLRKRESGLKTEVKV